VPEQNHGHELPLRTVLEGEGWESQIQEPSCIEEIDYLPFINRIADEPVRA